MRGSVDRRLIDRSLSGQAVREVFRDRTPGEDARAHVPARQPRDVVGELHGKRPIEAELTPQRFDLGRRRRLAGDQPDRVGGNDSRDHERDGE